MRSKIFNKILIEKLRTLTGGILCLAGILIFCAAQAKPCGPPRLKNHISYYFTDPVSNEFPVAGVVFNIYADGSHLFFVYVNGNYYPAETVFTLYINGAEIVALQSPWSYEDATRIAHVGDLVELRKNGAPYFSGVLNRPHFDDEWVDAVPVSSQTPLGELCSLAFGQAFLPTSLYPNGFNLVGLRFFSQSPVSSITLNEPPTQPDAPGAEIAELEISSYTQENLPGWFITTGKLYGLVLTDAQYRRLREGLLNYTVHASGYPNGFLSRHLRVYGVNQNSDFEGDGQSDLAVYRPSERNWYLLYSSNNQYNVVNFGLSTDKLVAGDYDADAKTDIAVYQSQNPNFPGHGIWQILKSSDNSVESVPWGLSDDIALTMNYDGNNVTDIVAFRPSNGTWYIKRMGDIIKPFSETPDPDGQNYRIIQWGMAGDKPLAGDFDGDGFDEIVNFRPSDGNWYIYNRVAGNYNIIHWGMSGDKPIAKDFDGDGKCDLAVYRPSDGTWYIHNSLDDSMTIRQFGLSSDIPVPADYDKDNVSDIAVFRPSNGTWYVLRSSDNSFFAVPFGLSGDIPVMAQN
jgi:hypothetical protein